MSKLSELYSAVASLHKLGFPFEEKEQQIRQLEEDIIKNEILPIVEQSIAPALQEVQREMVLVVEYKPNQPISVALSRKVKMSEISGVKRITPTASSAEAVGQPVTAKGARRDKPQDKAPTKQIKNPTKGLRVSFADGTEICHSTAIDTFKAVLRRVGLQEVHQLGIMHSGYNLVSREKRPLEPGCIFQHELDGWYIYSNIGNKEKARDLQTISEKLQLNLKIEEGKPEK